MTATQTPDHPHAVRAIIDALVEPLTIQQLIDITGQERKGLRDRVNRLREKGFIKPNIEDGHITYVRCARREREDRGAPPVPTSRTASPGRTPPARSHPMRGQAGQAKTGLTDAIRELLAQADQPMTCGEVVKALSGYSQSQVGSIISQRTRQGEFVARPPTGRSRRYWPASRPWPDEAATPAAAPKPSQMPETAAPDLRDLTRAQAIAELRAHEHALRDTDQGLIARADRFSNLIAALQS